ncbi:MAG: hypothetical protein WC312_07265 [Candidatus Omnitrophota bacterium]|jgi:oligoribonuclease (3'-5' exoribonuclease)
MVTTKTFERLSNISPQIATEAGTSEEVVRKVLEIAKTDIINRRRQPEKPPIGGISLRKASKKYKISLSTLSDWAIAGHIKTIKMTPHYRFVDESQIKEIAKRYKKENGRGNRAIIKIVKDCPINNLS